MFTTLSHLSEWVDQNFEMLYTNENFRKKFLNTKDIVRMRIEERKADTCCSKRLKIAEIERQVFLDNFMDHFSNIIIERRERIIVKKINELID